MAPPKDKEAILKQFRETLQEQDLIHDGDTIGTDDDTLLCVQPPLTLCSQPDVGGSHAVVSCARASST